MMWELTIRAKDRETAVSAWRYLQRVFLVDKKAVSRVSDAAFKVSARKDVAEIMRRALRDKFEGGVV